MLILHKTNKMIMAKATCYACLIYVFDFLLEEGKTEPAPAEPEATEQQEEEEEEVEYTDIETNIRDNILDNEPLTNETLDSMVPAWWKEEPFK